jgi:pyridoxamine-phosphate oxidase
MCADLTLPEPLPADPMPLFQEWFREAGVRRAQPNPDAMILATTASSGEPSARVVLCKRIDVAAGYVVFFTNYESRKGHELAARPRAAAVFHWDALHRQVRIEGPIIRSPDSESDQYFASRALDSRIAAWASAQSQPLESRGRCAFRRYTGRHDWHGAETAALGRLSFVGRHNRVVVGRHEPRARSRGLDAFGATSRRILVHRCALAQHAAQSLTT